ncbi:MAG: pirin family protein [Candidatus Rokubacteria bacterium CSP1-6]|nr:MAG: pirin family protein [Candidatus Rokubacteria bacterium CSP1-6]
MKQIIRSKDRYHHEMEWLSTYWHFSFDHYYDPANLSFGPLRVFNDDVIQPGTGFPPHSHRDMEIITYVLEGELEHQDNLGNRGRVHPGEIQVMSAGTGITHAEYNPSKSDLLHLLQIWVLPRTRSLKPRWEQREFSKAERQGRLLPVVSGAAGDTLRIDQDAVISIAALDPGQSVTHDVRPGRRAYAFVISGALDVNGDALAAGDQARITDESRLVLAASTSTELILLDLP